MEKKLMAANPQVIKDDVLFAGNKFTFSKLTFEDSFGEPRTWEYVRRPERSTNGDADCVVIVAVLKRPLMFDCLLLVKQYRPSLRAYTLEFPIGVLEANERPEDAALRELRDVTGYKGSIRSIGLVTAMDAGISDYRVRLITVEINGNEEQNKHIRLQNHERVNMEVVPVPIAELRDRLFDYVNDGVIIDCRVEMFAMGLNANARALTSPAI